MANSSLPLDDGFVEELAVWRAHDVDFVLCDGEQVGHTELVLDEVHDDGQQRLRVEANQCRDRVAVRLQTGEIKI